MLTRKREINVIADNSNKTRAEFDGQFDGKDFSLLPTEMLMKIFNYLSKEDECIKSITETCVRFNEIAQNRLGLHINFNDFTKDTEKSVIKRSYDNLILTGMEIDPNLKSLKAMLGTSKKYVTSLRIGFDGGQQRCRTKVYKRTLLELLKFLPNLKQLFAFNVEVLRPQLKCDQIFEHEYPNFKLLKKLVIKDCHHYILDCFKKATEIENFETHGKLGPNHKKSLRAITFNQQNLTALRTILQDTRTFKRFAELKVLEIPTHSISYLALSKNILTNAPNLEKLKIFSGNAQFKFPMSFFWNYKSSSLQSIEIEGIVGNDLNTTRLRYNFPSLEDFKSTTFIWRKLVVFSNGQEVEY